MMRGLLADVGAALASMFAAPVARAAEWDRIEAELVALTGSRDEALRMAQCAVEAAKAGVGSPDELVTLIRRGMLGGTRHQYDLHTLRRCVDDMLDKEFG